MTSPYPIVVIGIGNEYRSDDGVGIYIARAIESLNHKDVKVVTGIADGTTLIDAWQDARHVFVIDCTVSEAEPGTVYRFDAISGPGTGGVFGRHSTHALNISDAISLAETLNRLPPAMVIFGIEGKDYSVGAGLSAPVESSARQVITRILQEIEKIRNG